MNKVYLVIYKSEDGRSIDKVKYQLRLLGEVYEWVDTRKVFSAFLRPSEEITTAVVIRNKLRECINPFNEGAAAIEVNELNVADTEICQCLTFSKTPANVSEKDEARNFSRFKTRHEAFVTWKVEKPTWVYPDNIGSAIRMDINEWLWMPIKQNGQYERGKYEKYLG